MSDLAEVNDAGEKSVSTHLITGDGEWKDEIFT